MSINSIALAPLLQGFFHDWLIKQRDLSAHTIRSYRDTWKLFLRFAPERHRRPISKLRLEDLSASEVVDFLEHFQRDRRPSAGTRNCRLPAPRTSYSFLPPPHPLTLPHHTPVPHHP